MYVSVRVLGARSRLMYVICSYTFVSCSRYVYAHIASIQMYVMTELIVHVTLNRSKPQVLSSAPRCLDEQVFEDFGIEPPGQCSTHLDLTLHGPAYCKEI